MRQALLRFFFLIITLLMTDASICICYANSRTDSGLKYSQNRWLTVSKGLSHNGVTSICSDSRGYLWVGTYDGLSRYNGNSITTFKSSPQVTLFNTNLIRCIECDKRGNIWIGTDIGVAVYDYEMGHFVNLDYTSAMDSSDDCVVLDITPSKDGELMYCMTETNGLLIYDLDLNFKSHISLGTDDIYTDALHIKDDIYIYASNIGLRTYDFDRKNQQTILNEQFFNAKRIEKLNDSTLVVSLDRGVKVLRFNYDKTGVVKCNFTLPQSSLYYPEMQISTLKMDEYGTLWVGTTSKGVYALKDASRNIGDQLEKIRGNDRISTIATTPSRQVWVGSFDNGAYQFSNSNSCFKVANHSKLGHVLIYQMIKYDEKHLLIRYNVNKLALYNVDSDDIEPLPFSISSKNAPYLRFAMIDSRDNLWLYFNNGQKKNWFVRYDNGAKKGVEVHHKRLQNVGMLYLSCIQEDMHGNIWLSTSTNVYKISINDSGEIVNVHSIYRNNYFKDHKISKITTIFSDKDNNSIWIGTATQGLYRLKLKNKGSDTAIEELDVRNFRSDQADLTSISCNSINNIKRSPAGEMWVCTAQGGVCKLVGFSEEETPQFKVFSENEGLSNNVVKSLVFDKSNDVWISSNVGISRINHSTEKITAYKRGSGVPFDQFEYYAQSCSNGNLYFTERNNICYFNPDKLPKKAPLPIVQFSTLKIFNDEIEVGEEINGRVVLDSALCATSTITLKHYENLLSVGVDAIYDDGLQGKSLRYRLLPSSKEWMYIPINSQQISFNSLRPGDYTLEVEAANFFDEWSEMKRLNIVIEPPFWETKTAMFIYFVLAILLIYVIISVRINMEQLKHKLHIEELSKENLETMNYEKMRYFSNIAHELKTPLALIVAPISTLADRFSLDVDVQQKLSIVKRQIEKLLHLVEQSHGLEMKDSELLKRTDSVFDFNAFVEDNCLDFNFTAQYDSKNFVVKNYPTTIVVNADRGMIDIILNNLLSNAFKHTRKGETISLSISTIPEDMLLVIEVEDSGYGISPNDIEHIFERFYQGRDKGRSDIGGTGIGLYYTRTIVELHGGTIGVESSIGEGSKFTVKLPIIKEIMSELIERNVETRESQEQLLMSSEESSFEEYFVPDELRGSKLYLVDDNPEIRNLANSLLSPYFEVEEFADGVECAERLAVDSPDIVISDVMMPRMSGFELCRSIKSEVNTSHVPVILLTACNTIDDKIKGIEYGADSYISKPFYPKHLLARVVSLLKNRAAIRSQFVSNRPIVNPVQGEASVAIDNQFLKNLYEIFERNLDNEAIDINLIIQESGVSRTHLFQKVKALTKESPYELLKNYRLDRAAELLAKGDMQVNEIYYMTGFKSRTHFIKLFKDRFGVTPRQYAKRSVDEE